MVIWYRVLETTRIKASGIGTCALLADAIPITNQPHKIGTICQIYGILPSLFHSAGEPKLFFFLATRLSKRFMYTTARKSKTRRNFV